MPRPEKVEAVADIKDRLSQAEAVFVAEYSGLTMAEQQQLRRKLKEAESELKVVKMTLARRAASELGHDDLLGLLVGPTGLAFASGDAAVAAKVLSDFAKDHARLVVKGALLGGEVLAPERVSMLADLEPREVLLAKIAGVLQSPMASMAGLLAAMPQALATMVQQLIERDPSARVEGEAEGSVETDAEAESADEPGEQEGSREPEPADEAAEGSDDDQPEADEPEADESNDDQPDDDQPDDDQPEADEPEDDEPEADEPAAEAEEE